MDLFTSAAVLQCSISYKVCYLLLAFLFPFCQTLLARAPALVPLSPFVSILNAPTELCMKKFKINVDIGLFQMTGSTLRSSRGQNISLFYTDRLGYYPYINLTTGQSYNGGIPQMVNMDQHLKKAKEDILYYMPYSTQKGLAVIDWEDWRPSWIRNWASKTIYRNKSIEFALKNDLTLNKEKATEVAKAQFEFAAKSLMLNTLKLGKSLRQEYLWGFYNFPNCQNYDYNQNPDTYKGNCPDIEKSRNDELSWLWIESSVFYVNIYLESSLKSSNNAALYSRCRIKETMRLSSLSNSSYSLPIYAYFRPVYTDQYEEYLSKYDLINTIGESAALGAAGFVLWGDTELTISELQPLPFQESDSSLQMDFQGSLNYNQNSFPVRIFRLWISKCSTFFKFLFQRLLNFSIQHWFLCFIYMFLCLMNFMFIFHINSERGQFGSYWSIFRYVNDSDWSFLSLSTQNVISLVSIFLAVCSLFYF